MRHYLVETTLPLAGGAGARAGVGSELASLLVLGFLGVHEGDGAARVGVLAGEHDVAGHLLHGEVADVAERAAARGAARQLGSAAGAHQVPALALQDGRQHIVEAHGALKQRRQVGRHGRGHAAQRGDACHCTTGTASSSAPLVVCAHDTVTLRLTTTSDHRSTSPNNLTRSRSALFHL